MKGHTFFIELETGKELLSDKVTASDPVVPVSELRGEMLAHFGVGSPVLETEAESDEDESYQILGFDNKGAGKVLRPNDGNIDVREFKGFRAVRNAVIG